jgi:hypothetical protein
MPFLPALNPKGLLRAPISGHRMGKSWTISISPENPTTDSTALKANQLLLPFGLKFKLIREGRQDGSNIDLDEIPVG